MNSRTLVCLRRPFEQSSVATGSATSMSLRPLTAREEGSNLSTGKSSMRLRKKPKVQIEQPSPKKPIHHSHQSKNSSLNCLYTNAASLSASKLVEIEMLAEKHELDVVAIAETWFDESSTVSLNNFSSIFRKDRSGKHGLMKGGGVAIYIRDGIEASEVTDQNLRQQFSKENVEQVWCQIIDGKERILIGCIYRRPPGSSSENCIAEAAQINKSIFLAKLAVQSKKFTGLLIAGDFNYPGLSWDSEGLLNRKMASKLENDFANLITEQYLSQSVNFPTFSTSTGDFSNTLDLVICESSCRINELSSLSPLGSTSKGRGHLCLVWQYMLSDYSSKQQQRSSRFIFKRGDYESMSEHLNKFNWFLAFSDKNVEECYDIFLREYNVACSQFVPKAKSQISHRPSQWISTELRHLLNRKDQLWHINKKISWKSAYLARLYKKCRYEVKKATSLSLKKFEFDIANDKYNPKRLFAYINSRQKVKLNISALNGADGSTLTNGNDIANELNKNFNSVFVREPSDQLPLPSRLHDDICLNDTQISTELIRSRLMKLDHSKTGGIDGINPWVLKNCAASFAVPLEIIFRKSIDTGKIPSIWKRANISPIFKKGSRLLPSNY